METQHAPTRANSCPHPQLILTTTGGRASQTTLIVLTFRREPNNTGRTREQLNTAVYCSRQLLINNSSRRQGRMEAVSRLTQEGCNSMRQSLGMEPFILGMEPFIEQPPTPGVRGRLVGIEIQSGCQLASQLDRGKQSITPCVDRGIVL